MTKRIVVDPITRIEGHLRMEADIENGVITDAFSTGTMIRGIEIIVKDRDPRDVWAYVGRVCGVCTSIHSLCSVRAVEDALHIVIPPNAEQVRNLMQSAITIQDHVTHFYQLQALDWVDVMSALNADPRKAAEVAQSLSEWPKNSIGYFVEIQKKIRTFIETSKFSIFSNGYWGHPAYKLPPEVNLVALAHYLEALEVQKEIVVVHLIFNEFSFLYVCHDGVCGYSRSGYGCQSQSYLVGRRFDAESFDVGEVMVHGFCVPESGFGASNAPVPRLYGVTDPFVPFDDCARIECIRSFATHFI